MTESFWLACMASGTLLLMVTLWAWDNDRDPPIP